MQGYLTKAAVLMEMGKAAKDPADKKAAYQAAIDEANRLLKLVDEKNPATPGREPVRSSAEVSASGWLGKFDQGDCHALRGDRTQSRTWRSAVPARHLLPSDRRRPQRDCRLQARRQHRLRRSAGQPVGRFPVREDGRTTTRRCGLTATRSTPATATRRRT